MSFGDTQRLKSSKFGDAFRGHEQANFEVIIELVWSYTVDGIIKRDWTRTWRQSLDITPGHQTLFVKLLPFKHGIVTSGLYL